MPARGMPQVGRMIEHRYARPFSVYRGSVLNPPRGLAPDVFGPGQAVRVHQFRTAILSEFSRKPETEATIIAVAESQCCTLVGRDTDPGVDQKPVAFPAEVIVLPDSPHPIAASVHHRETYIESASNTVGRFRFPIEDQTGCGPVRLFAPKV